MLSIDRMTPHRDRRREQAALIRSGTRLMFTAHYEAERGTLSWFAQVPEIYAATSASSFSELEEAVRKLVTITLEVDADAFDVRLERGR